MTYNLAPMFRKAGFYDAMKGADRDFFEVVKGDIPKHAEQGPINAAALGELVRAGLKDMIDNADEYRKLNPKNGWGDYDGALKFTKELLQACEDYPDGVVSFSG